MFAAFLLPSAAFAVPGSGHITGKVTAATGGAPLEGVDVSAYELEAGDWFWTGQDATTDSNGDYDVSGLGTGTYRLGMQDYSGSYLGEYYNDAASVEAATDIPVTDGVTTSGKDVQLATAGHITGKLTASGGAGVEAIEVRAYTMVDGSWDWFETAESDQFGDYDVGGLPTGTYRLQFYDWNGSYLSECYDNVATIEAGTDISVTAGSTTADKNAVLAAAGHITGRVTNAGGAPLQNINVCVYYPGDNDWTESVATDSNGEYNIGGLPTGTYRLEFTDDSGAYLGEFFNNATTLASATGVSVTAGSTTSGKNASLAAAGHITGKVTNQGGTGLADVNVSAYALIGGNWEYVRDADTDSDGTFNVGGLATGTYRIEFYDYTDTYLGEYYNNAPTLDSATDISVTAGATTSGKNAVLGLPGHITGNVRESNGDPIPDVEVTAFVLDGGEWEYAASATADVNGDYDVSGLHTGTYRLEFFDYGGKFIREYYNDVDNIDDATDVPVTAGSTTSGKDAVLADAGHVTGKVTGTDGLGLGSVEVVAYADDGSGWAYFGESETDETGNYDLGGLTTDNYRVMFRDRTGLHAGEYWDDVTTLAAASNIGVTAGATTPSKDATLSVAGKITGKVTNAGGAGIEGICVTVFEESGGGATEPWIHTHTDSLGNYDASGLATGSYKVRFEDNEVDRYLGEFYNDGATFDDGAPVAVTAGSETPDIDVVLGQVATSTYRNVYRFRNIKNGFYLWSADENEKATIIATLSDTWKYEGVAYKLNVAHPDNKSPLWRFLNLRGGFYLYSSDAAEKDNIVNTLSNEWRLEGPAYNVSRVRTGRPVWRFRNNLDGTYLLSADPAERDTIVETLQDTWTLEGVAFYIMP